VKFINQQQNSAPRSHQVGKKVIDEPVTQDLSYYHDIRGQQISQFEGRSSIKSVSYDLRSTAESGAQARRQTSVVVHGNNFRQVSSIGVGSEQWPVIGTPYHPSRRSKGPRRPTPIAAATAWAWLCTPSFAKMVAFDFATLR